MKPFEKFEQDGMIAVLYSPDWGAGWYTWNSEEGLLFDREGLLFDRDIVELILKGDREAAIKVAEEKYPGMYDGGGDTLEVAWVPKGQRFIIDEYDGYESIRMIGLDLSHVA